MGELVSSDSCVDICAVHMHFVIDNLWYIHLPQSRPGALGRVMCILANVIGAVCGCKLICLFITNLTFWSLLGCSVSPVSDKKCYHKRKEAIQPNSDRNSDGRQSAFKHITDHILMSCCPVFSLRWQSLLSSLWWTWWVNLHSQMVATSWLFHQMGRGLPTE